MSKVSKIVPTSIVLAQPTSIIPSLPSSISGVFTGVQVRKDPKQPYRTLEHRGDAILYLAVTELVDDEFPELTFAQRNHVRQLFVTNMMLKSIEKALQLQPEKNTNKADLYEAVVGAISVSTGSRDHAINFVKETLRERMLQYVRFMTGRAGNQNIVAYTSTAALVEKSQAQWREASGWAVTCPGTTPCPRWRTTDLLHLFGDPFHRGLPVVPVHRILELTWSHEQPGPSANATSEFAAVLPAKIPLPAPKAHSVSSPATASAKPSRFPWRAMLEDGCSKLAVPFRWEVLPPSKKGECYRLRLYLKGQLAMEWQSGKTIRKRRKRKEQVCRSILEGQISEVKWLTERLSPLSIA